MKKTVKDVMSHPDSARFFHSMVKGGNLASTTTGIKSVAKDASDYHAQRRGAPDRFKKLRGR